MVVDEGVLDGGKFKRVSRDHLKVVNIESSYVTSLPIYVKRLLFLIRESGS